MAEREVVFVHIPRTAGSSLRLICKRNGFTIIGHNLRDPDYQDYCGYRRQSGSDVFAFAFVRNPWDRVVSAFHYLNQGGRSEEDRQDALRFTRKYEGDFRRFVREAFDDPRLLEQIHFRPQYAWICDPDGKLAIDFVGRFESLKADLATLFQELGLRRKILNLNFRPPELNKILRKFFQGYFRFTGVEWDVLAVRNTSARGEYRTYYDSETAAVIANVYKEDIERFGYAY